MTFQHDNLGTQYRSMALKPKTTPPPGKQWQKVNNFWKLLDYPDDPRLPPDPYPHMPPSQKLPVEPDTPMPLHDVNEKLPMPFMIRGPHGYVKQKIDTTPVQRLGSTKIAHKKVLN